MLVLDQTRPDVGMPVVRVIVPGVLAIGGGVTMIVFGARRRRAYNAWRRGEPFVNQRRGAISPFVGRTRDRTGTYGVRLQF